MVAMLGWIIPEPFAMPPTRQGFPFRMNANVSVVMIASAAASPPVSERPADSASPAARIGSMGSGSPITPVEATITSFSATPVIRAARPHILRAFCSPSALQVFALPLLTTTACAVPSAKCSLVTAIGAPLTLFCV